VLQNGPVDTPPDLHPSAATVATLDRDAATIAATLDDPTLLPLSVAVNPLTATAVSGPREPIGLAIQRSAHSFQGLGHPYVATPELLQHLGIDPASIDPSTELLTSRADKVVLIDMTTRPDDQPSPTGTRQPSTSTTPAQRVDLPTYSSAPSSLITETAMRDHGWVAWQTGWLVESPKALTSGQITAARHAAAAVGMTIEVRSNQDNLATLRTVATAVGALLALAIVAMTIGLLRGESAGDLRTLTATGAAARTRRALTASTAGAMALLGVVLSIAGAYIALVAGYHAELDKLVPLPVVDLLLLAIGLPAVAAGAGWLLAGREPAVFSRQALD
jgi:putative ABC transport system permease protein